jgi:hypothetical protein
MSAKINSMLISRVKFTVEREQNCYKYIYIFFALNIIIIIGYFCHQASCGMYTNELALLKIWLIFQQL